MRVMQCLRRQSLLIAIAIFFPIGLILPDGAIGTPAIQQKGCLNNEDLSFAVKRGGYYMVFSQDNAPINIREEPTVKSRIRKAVSSKESVNILRQVVGDDGYCWLNVKVVLSGESTATSTITVKGWVRGDLVINGAD